MPGQYGEVVRLSSLIGPTALTSVGPTCSVLSYRPHVFFLDGFDVTNCSGLNSSLIEIGSSQGHGPPGPSLRAQWWHPSQRLLS